MKYRIVVTFVWLCGLCHISAALTTFGKIPQRAPEAKDNTESEKSEKGNVTINSDPSQIVSSLLNKTEELQGNVTLDSTIPAVDEPVKIKGVLEVNSTLERGESWISKTENVTLTMQDDGNLVLYDKFGKPVWNSDTTRRGWKAVFEPGGNFVVYSAYGDRVWSSNTDGHPNPKLIVQDDSNLVIYDGDRAIWSSRTEKCSKPKYKFAPTSGPVEVNLTSSNELASPFGLEMGQWWEFKTGSLIMQENGNLVLRNSNNETIWDTNTQGRGARATFQEDGNFVVYSDFWRPVWSSRTSGNSEAKIVPQYDGNLFISKGNKVLWTSYTDRALNLRNEDDVLATQPKEVQGISVLNRGQSWASKTANLTMQLDGNLVVYDEFFDSCWSSRTVGKGWRAIFHEDGNFVIYNIAWQSVWSSDTKGHPNATLAVQDDGNVVIYDGCKIIWATHTDH